MCLKQRLKRTLSLMRFVKGQEKVESSEFLLLEQFKQSQYPPALFFGSVRAGY
jgi:hypothetical protein